MQTTLKIGLALVAGAALATAAMQGLMPSVEL